jgi:hypothetical protein
MDRRECVTEELRKAVARIDDVLGPWGFAFTHDGVSSSHQGPYASGHYVRGNTRIGLACRDTIDNIDYSHSLVSVSPYCEETERFTIGHDTLMRGIGALADCWLVIAREDSGPTCVRARNGDDPVEAWKHDLLLAASVLKEPSDEFVAIMRRGARTYSVSPRGSG